MRPFNFPADLDALMAITAGAYQFQNRPEWNIPANIAELLKPQFDAARRVYPLLQVAAMLDARLRHVITGVIVERDEQPVAAAMMIRMYQQPRIELGNVGVLPAYRQQGIARNMIHECITIARRHNIARIELNVIEGNTVPLHLYESLGFEQTGRSMELTQYTPYRPEPAAIPPGFRWQRVPFGDGRLQEALLRRQGIPVPPGNLTMLWALRQAARQFFSYARMSFYGWALLDSTDAPVAYISILFHDSTNTAQFMLHPDHTTLAVPIMNKLMYTAFTISPEVPLALTLTDLRWQHLARDYGFLWEYTNLRMALNTG